MCIIPVFNGEAYLEECIESVLRQTYARREYVDRLDNRSTPDGTAAILAGYAAQDARIRVESPPEFPGPALELQPRPPRDGPVGPLLQVLCADDWLFPECLERMVAVAEAHPEVGVVGAYRLDDIWVNLDGVPVDRDVIPGHEFCVRGLRGGPYLTGSPTSTMIRAEPRPLARRLLRHHPVRGGHRLPLSHLVRARRGLGAAGAHLHPPARGHHQTDRHRLHTYTIENLRALVRYGPRVMAPAEYRRRLRAQLGQYAWFLAKQGLRGQTRSAEFREFHLHNLTLLEEESWRDREVAAAGRLCRCSCGVARARQSSRETFSQSAAMTSEVSAITVS